MKVRFRGLGSSRRQVLTLDDDGSISGYVVPADKGWGFKLMPLHIDSGHLRYLFVRSGRNAAAGFLVLAVLVWVAMGWIVITGTFADFGYSQAVVFWVWVVMCSVVVELWAVTAQSWLEIGVGWGKPVVVSVTPWSRKKVEGWATAVREELGLPSSNVAVDDGFDDHTVWNSVDLP